MISYSLSFFQTVNTQKILQLDCSTKSLIDSLSEKVNAPNYRRNPHFKKKKRNVNNLKNIKNSIKNGNCFSKKKKTSFNDIRLELNKLTDKNYNENIMNIWEIIENNEDDEKYKKVADLLFTISSSNKNWSHLYAKFYKKYLMDKNVNLDNQIQHYKELMGSVYDITYENDYQKFCNENKKKDKRLAYSTFIVHLLNEGVINADVVVDIINNEIIKFKSFIDKKGFKDIVEEIMHNLLVLVFKGCPSLRQTHNWDNIITNLLEISKMKSKDHESLTSKILFKLTDEIDML